MLSLRYLPALTGRVKTAQQFILANLIAFEIGQFLFALLPAIGPWYGYHFAPNPNFAQCQADLLALRQPGPYLHHPCGVVCFPSGHALGAIFSTYCLWGFKWLRGPVAIFAALLILSTMTLRWHYFFDVLGGGVVAFISLIAARRLTR